MDDLKSRDVDMDRIYDFVDDLMRSSKWSYLNVLLMWLGQVTVFLSCDAMLAVLTSTLPGKSKLPQRHWFFKRVWDEFDRRCELEDGLLDGLE